MWLLDVVLENWIKPRLLGLITKTQKLTKKYCWFPKKTASQLLNYSIFYIFMPFRRQGENKRCLSHPSSTMWRKPCIRMRVQNELRSRSKRCRSFLYHFPLLSLISYFFDFPPDSLAENCLMLTCLSVCYTWRMDILLSLLLSFSFLVIHPHTLKCHVNTECSHVCICTSYNHFKYGILRLNS